MGGFSHDDSLEQAVLKEAHCLSDDDLNDVDDDHDNMLQEDEEVRQQIVKEGVFYHTYNDLSLKETQALWSTEWTLILIQKPFLNNANPPELCSKYFVNQIIKRKWIYL